MYEIFKMPYARKRSTRRAPSRKRAAPRRPAPRRRRPTGKPTHRRVFRPPRPARQIGYLPFAESFRVRLPYRHSTGLTAPLLSVTGGIAFRLNSLFDPDQSGVGHQPMQYDQLQGIYQQYLVRGCSVKLHWSNPSADGLYVGYNIYTSPVAGSDQAGGKTLEQVQEKRSTRFQSIHNSGSQKLTQSIYVPMSGAFGLPSMVINNDRDNFAAAVAANPVRQCYLEVLVLDTTGGTANVHLDLELTYYAEMYKFIPQAQS